MSAGRELRRSMRWLTLTVATSVGLVAVGALATPTSAANNHKVTVTCFIGSGHGSGAGANGRLVWIEAAAGDTVTVSYRGCGWFIPDTRSLRLDSPALAADGEGVVTVPTSGTLTFTVIAPPVRNSVPLNLYPERPSPTSADMSSLVWGQSPDGSQPAAPVADCPDVMFIGARGSGEAQGNLNSPGGPDMERLYAQAASVIQGAGKTISSRQVGPSYSAPGVETITANMGSDKKKWLSQFAQNLAGYLNAEKGGVTELDLILTKQAALCPSQRFILAGYSQGAMVVNDVLLAAARSRPAWFNAVKSVVLVANPERLKADKYLEFGTASPGDGVCSFTDSTSQSLKLRRCWTGGPSVLGGSITDRVISVCLKDDIVCSTQQWASDYTFAAANAAARKSALNLGTSTHSLYKNRKEMDAAARRAAQMALR